MSSGSPTMSDRTMENTLAGAQCCANRPAFTPGEALAGIVFISTMSAPQARSSRVMRCCSSGVMNGSSKSATAAGHQKRRRLLRRQPLRQSQRMASCRKGRRIRDRVPGLKNGKAADCTARMSMLRDHDTVRDPRAERLVCSVFHLPRRFSDCDEIDPPGKLRLLQRELRTAASACIMICSAICRNVCSIVFLLQHETGRRTSLRSGSLPVGFF